MDEQSPLLTEGYSDSPADQQLGISQGLDALLKPRSIALVGASDKEGKAGHSLYEMARIDGFQGTIWPVNPRLNRIGGHDCFGSLADLPEAPDHAALCLPNEKLEEALDQVIALGIRAATIFATGHLAEDDRGVPLRQRLAQKARKHNIAICGPNCMGFYNRTIGLRVAAFPSPPGLRIGGVAWLAQSGSAFSALCHNDRRLGFSHCVSSGAESVTTTADYMNWMIDQAETRVIGLFLEGIRDPERFLQALKRAAEADIPVVALKVGRTDLSAAMAQSHTGALVGSDEAFSAVCKKYGVCRVDDLDEMIATLALFDSPRRTQPGGLATIHDSGGQRELLVDLAAQCDLTFADIEPATKNKIQAVLEPGLVAENPLDAWGTDRDFVARYQDCITSLLDDPNVGLCTFFSDLRDGYWYSKGILDAVINAVAKSEKLVAIASNISLSNDQAIALRAAEHGIPLIKGTKPALLAIKHCLGRTRRKTGSFLREDAICTPSAEQEGWRRSTGGAPISAGDSFRILADFGIPSPRCIAVNSNQVLEDLTAGLNFPLVLKTAGDLAHKSDVGGVILNIHSLSELQRAYGEMASRFGPAALIMEQFPTGIEIALGGKVDPDFGPLVMLSAGGLLVEMLDDKVVALAPFGPDMARELLSELRVFKLLTGYRNHQACDIEALCQTISRFSEMIFYLRDVIREIDLNPVIVAPLGHAAVDCLIKWNREKADGS
ncbi:MAG: acetate--CoA ligase family protein [Pseudomonadota bacterium]